jgi:predicted phosphohydrolase
MMKPLCKEAAAMPKLCAISDLHLSFFRPKPMDRFGAQWVNHVEKIENAWCKIVSDDDIVLIAGDISWAMRTSEAIPDMDFLNTLPGIKILGRGNHDYWWPDSRAKLQMLERPNIYFLHNNLSIGKVAVAGIRLRPLPYCLWPGAAGYSEEDIARIEHEANYERITRHEINHLKRSLDALPEDAEIRVCLLHYPPCALDGKPTPITDVIAEYDIDFCVFGHIHANYQVKPAGAWCKIGKTLYALTSADQVGLSPIILLKH